MATSWLEDVAGPPGTRRTAREAPVSPSASPVAKALGLLTSETQWGTVHADPAGDQPEQVPLRLAAKAAGLAAALRGGAAAKGRRADDARQAALDAVHGHPAVAAARAASNTANSASERADLIHGAAQGAASPTAPRDRFGAAHHENALPKDDAHARAESVRAAGADHIAADAHRRAAAAHAAVADDATFSKPVRADARAAAKEHTAAAKEHERARDAHGHFAAKSDDGAMVHMDRALAAANHESVKDPKVGERVSTAREKVKTALASGDKRAADKAVLGAMHEHNPEAVQEHLRAASEAVRDEHGRFTAKSAAWPADMSAAVKGAKFSFADLPKPDPRRNGAPDVDGKPASAEAHAANAQALSDHADKLSATANATQSGRKVADRADATKAHAAAAAAHYDAATAHYVAARANPPGSPDRASHEATAESHALAGGAHTTAAHQARAGTTPGPVHRDEHGKFASKSADEDVEKGRGFVGMGDARRAAADAHQASSAAANGTGSHASAAAAHDVAARAFRNVVNNTDNDAEVRARAGDAAKMHDANAAKHRDEHGRFAGA